MSGGGGSSTTKATVPAFLETAYQQGIGMGKDVASTGYVPYYGPDVAAFSPMQQASFQGTNQMASAFGMPTGAGPDGQQQSYLPEPTQFAGGVSGYSSAPIFEQAQQQLQENRPAQYDYLNSFSIDPVTGEMGSRAPSNQPVALEMQGGGRSGGK